jgi:hypothetical protein
MIPILHGLLTRPENQRDVFRVPSELIPTSVDEPQEDRKKQRCPISIRPSDVTTLSLSVPFFDRLR